MSSFVILLKSLISKFIESIKKPIVFIYNLYCLAIYIKYNYTILDSISDSNSSNDRINMILYISVFISSILLLKNKYDRLGCLLFFNNNYFCLINLIWLLYIIFRIAHFGLIESFSVLKEKSFNFSFWNIAYNSVSYLVLGGYFVFYKIFYWTVSAGEFYMKSNKLESVIELLDNHFKEKNLDYIYLYVIILSINACILFLMIVFNFLFNIVYKVYNNIH